MAFITRPGTGSQNWAAGNMVRRHSNKSIVSNPHHRIDICAKERGIVGALALVDRFSSPGMGCMTKYARKDRQFATALKSQPLTARCAAKRRPAYVCSTLFCQR
eukprot:1194137-Prorocentrum_minimum.AAC.1